MTSVAILAQEALIVRFCEQFNTMALSVLRAAEMDMKKKSGKKRKSVIANDEGESIRDDTANTPQAIEANVNRTITRCCVTAIPASAIDVVKINGQTMRHRMVADRTELLNNGRQRVDTDYLPKLKRKYLLALHGVTGVTEDPIIQEVVPVELILAIDKSKAKQKNNRKLDGVVHWLWNAKEALNTKTVSCLVDLLIEIHIAKNLKQAIFAQEVYAALVRLNHHVSHTQICKHGWEVLQDSLATIYHSENRNDEAYGFKAFWDKYLNTAKFFLAVDLVQVVLGESDVAKSSAAIGSLAVGSKLGTSIFLPHCPTVVTQHVNRFMRQKAAELNDASELNHEVAAKTLAVMIAEAERLSFDKLLKPSDFEFDFAEQVVNLEVNSGVEMARLYTEAVVKSVGFRNGDLNQLKALHDINPIKVDRKQKMELSLVQNAKLVFDRMDALLSQSPFHTITAMVTFMESKKSIWFPHDPTFVLEVALAKALNGSLGNKLFWEQTLACLPSAADADPDMLIAAEKIKGTHGTKAWMVADASMRGMAQSVLDIIMMMLRGDAPHRGSFPPGSEMENVSARLALFCVEGKSKGLPALKARIEKLDAAITEETLKDLGLCKKCEMFAWLLVDKSDVDLLRELGLKANALVMGKPLPTGADAVSASMAAMVAIHSSEKIKNDRVMPPKGTKKRK
jgi:hypothetical protein